MRLDIVQSLALSTPYGYVQMILRFPETQPDVHHNFMEIYHVLICTDTFWAGLSAHLIMEQWPIKNTSADTRLGEIISVSDLNEII